MKSCDNCVIDDGESAFPYYGLAPHEHPKRGGTVFLEKEQWPANFQPDPEAGGKHGTYTHCLKCGGTCGELHE